MLKETGKRKEKHSFEETHQKRQKAISSPMVAVPPSVLELHARKFQACTYCMHSVLLPYFFTAHANPIFMPGHKHRTSPGMRPLESLRGTWRMSSRARAWKGSRKDPKLLPMPSWHCLTPISIPRPSLIQSFVLEQLSSSNKFLTWNILVHSYRQTHSSSYPGRPKTP